MLEYFLIILTCFLLAIAQILFKKNLKSFDSFSSLIKVFTSQKIIIGLLLYAISFFIYVFSLSKLRLSLAYSLLSFSFIFVTLLAKFYLKEKISFKRAIGILLIIIGVILMSL